MKIVSLSSTNVLRLKAVLIEPGPDNVVTISGANGAGKTSVLRSIEMAFAGGKSIPPEPIRRGERKAQIIAKLDSGLVVERTFSGDRTELVVRAPDGARYGSPQKVLDDLVGELAFDPLEFSRMKPADQVTTLRKLGRLDFAQLDHDRAAAFDTRTEVSRELRHLQGAREKLSTGGEDVAPVDLAALSAELTRRMQENRARDEAEAKLSRLKGGLTRHMDEIKKAEQHLAEMREELMRIDGKGRALRLELDAMPKHDLDALTTEIAAGTATNTRAAECARAREIDAEADVLTTRAEELTQQIQGIDAEKAKHLAEAKLPVQGLAFTESPAGVTFQGLPLEQAAASEKIRVSVAIGMALNPKLRVLLIHDGSLLDAGSLAMVAKMAADADAQVWIEKVSDGADCSVVIEDGEVQGAEKAKRDPAADHLRLAHARREPGEEG